MGHLGMGGAYTKTKFSRKRGRDHILGPSKIIAKLESGRGRPGWRAKKREEKAMERVG